ncbi:MAG: transposase [Bacillota bacterium]
MKEFIYEAIEGDGYAYGYKKLTAELRDVRSLVINQKKVYRLCNGDEYSRPSARGQEEAS